MKIDIKGILEGVKNSVFINDEIEKIAAARIAICRGCEFNSNKLTDEERKTLKRPDEHCLDCGCNLHLKTRCLSCECPKQYWLMQVTPEEDEKIKEKLQSNDRDK